MPRRAFTLIELLVVIAIIGLLSTVAVIALGSARVKARDTWRKSSLVQIAKALELYQTANNAYPSTGGSAAWRGACTNYGSRPDTGAGAWIPGFGEYMATLPHDPETNKAHPSRAPICANAGENCFVYTSNGVDYKVLNYCVPEGTMLATDPFYDPTRPTWSWTVYSANGKTW